MTPPDRRGVGLGGQGSGEEPRCVDAEPVAFGAGPGEGGRDAGLGGLGWFVGPAGEGLHPMMGAAQRGQVARTRRAAVAVGASVVEVAASRSAGAEREDAAWPGEQHLFADRLGGRVAADAVVVVEVEDRADRHGGGGAAPRGDLVEEDVGAGLAELGDLGVGHQDRDIHPTSGSAELQCLLRAADLAGGHRPADVERQVGDLADLGGHRRDGGVEVEGVGSVQEPFDPGVPVDAGATGADVEASGVGVTATLRPPRGRRAPVPSRWCGRAGSTTASARTARVPGRRTPHRPTAATWWTRRP